MHVIPNPDGHNPFTMLPCTPREMLHHWHQNGFNHDLTAQKLRTHPNVVVGMVTHQQALNAHKVGKRLEAMKPTTEFHAACARSLILCMGDYSTREFEAIVGINYKTLGHICKGQRIMSFKEAFKISDKVFPYQSEHLKPVLLIATMKDLPTSLY